MPPVIVVHNPRGGGSCDARCYNATGNHCQCVCQGANHGAGADQALRNAARHADQWTRRHRRRHPHDTPAIEPPLPLWPAD